MNRVLLVDSDELFAQSLAQLLHARGVVTETVSDGTAVLPKAHAFQPHAVVLCVELHKISGYSVCNKLRKDPDFQSVPLVLISRLATAETFEEHQTLKTRADVYVREPCTPEAVLQALDSLGGVLQHTASKPEVLAEDAFETVQENMDKQEPVMEVNLFEEETMDVPMDDVALDWIQEDPPVLPGDVLLSHEEAREATQAMASVLPQLQVQAPALAPLLDPVAAAPKAAYGAGLDSESVLDQLRQENRQLRAKVQKLEQSIEEKALAFNDRLLEESTRSREALELKRKLSAVERDMASFQQAIDKGRAELEEAHAQSQQLRAHMEQAEAERRHLDQELSALHTQLQEALQQLQSVRDHAAALDVEKTYAVEEALLYKQRQEQARKHVDQALAAIGELDI